MTDIKRDKNGRFMKGFHPTTEFKRKDILKSRRQINGKLESHVVWCSQEGNLPYVPKKCVIHHINGNKLDNKPENLVMLPESYHKSLHLTVNNPRRRE